MNRSRTLGLTALVAAAVLATPTVAPAAAVSPTAAPGTRVVTAVDFTDRSVGTWSASGGGADTLSVVDVDENPALLVSRRAADYVGIQSPAGLFAPGKTYHFSMRARLASGTEGSSSIRFVMKPMYAWIGNTTITAADWTTVTGDYTVPADADPAQLQVYLGTADMSGPYSYLVDDIVVTTPDDTPTGPTDPTDPTDPTGPVAGGGAVSPTATPVSRAQGSGDVAALTFDDGPNGAATSDLLDFLKEKKLYAVFCVIGQNIQAPGGAELLRRIVAEGHTLCNHSTSYADMGAMSADAVRADLTENLRIIREALGDPAAPVPFFRAPNGSWGATADVAVSLGMQPLAVVNTISDWSESDVDTLTANLRAAMRPGEVVLVHDGGGDRTASIQATRTVVTERLAAGWSFTLPEGAPAIAPAPGTALLSTDFEDGALDGWTPRQGASATPSVTVVTPGAAGTGHAALVSERTHEGDGIQHDVTGLLAPGATYHVEAQVRFAPGGTAGRGLTLSMRTVTGTSASYANLIQVENASPDGWATLSGDFTVPAYDTAAELYVEARYNSGNLSDFLVDQIRVTVPEEAAVDTSLTPLKDTVDFPLGVAVDSRETTGAAAQLLLHHFSQITPENHMKVEAWYTADHTFARNAEATALLDFASAHGLRLYGHVLVWYSQTPDWFFQDDSGRDLAASAADKQFLRDRLARHIDDVARSIAEDYGPYGSSTNPIVAWDVVNEVISDQATADGLRPSRWYQILGEEYIPLAFRLADHAFNHTYAAAGSDRPVKLFINDYNTEQDLKGAQYRALVDRLLAEGTPIDGVGHQFHVSVNTPISSLQGALARFAGTGLAQEVTELDVTINPATEANRIRQGYYYRDVFAALRDYQAHAPAAEKLFAATIWGLTDNRSWRSEQQPLVFDAALQPKPAYTGIVDDAQLPPLQTTATVFGGDIPLDDRFADAGAWTDVPAQSLTDSAGSFTARWMPGTLTVLVRAASTTADALEFTLNGTTYRYEPGAAGSVPGRAVTKGGERLFIAQLPLGDAQVGSTANFDVRVLSGGAALGGWNSPGATGSLTLVEPLSYVEIPEASAPVVDGAADAVWADAAVSRTAKHIEGDPSGAQAEVRTVWHGNTLYALFDVTDPVVDLSNSDPWNRDSVELFLDLENAKSGAYGPNDTQIRVTADGDVSFGSGSATAQAARVRQVATSRTATGYIVEVAIDLIGQSGGQSDVPLGGAGHVLGIDFQVNDGRAGSRFAVHTWADPTGTGYQSTARWGVARLVTATDEPGGETGGNGGEGEPGGNGGSGTDAPWATVDVGSGRVAQGGTLSVTVSGLTPGQQIGAVLHSDPLVATGIPAADASGRTTFTLAIPTGFAVGAHTLEVTAPGREPVRTAVTVTAATPGARLATTGAQVPWAIALLGAAALAAAGLLRLTRRRA